MAITWLAPADITPGTTGSWQDVDLSASVPAGATGVILHVAQANSAFGYRCNGSTDNRTALSANINANWWAVVGCDVNRVIEILTNAGSVVYLVGYFGADEATFFTNGVDKSTATTGSWEDVSIAADLQGAETAIAACLQVFSGPSSTGVAGLRCNGSTDDRTAQSAIVRIQGFVVPVDESSVFEQYNGSTWGDLYVLGYLKDGGTFLVNGTDLSLAETLAWTDLSPLPAGASGGFVEVYEGIAAVLNAGLRQNGSAEDIYAATNHCMGIVQADASRLIEGKIGGTEIDFFLLGYAGGVAAAPGVITRSPMWGRF